MNLFKKSAIAAGLAATALASTTPAMARDYHRGNDNTAAVAIGAGILGLAVGAIAASSNNRNDRYYEDGGYRGGYQNSAYASDWSYRDGYYWDRNGGRHGRDEYQRYGRDHRDDYRRGYDHDRDDYRRGY
jgi:hypothetical protein